MKKVVVDYETYYDGEVSVTEQGIHNYSKAADAYIVSATVGDEVQCGTIAEMGPTLEQMAKDPQLEFWAANSNFEQVFFEKYHGPVVHPWQCVLDLGSFNQCPRDLAGLSRTVLREDVDKSIRDAMKGQRYEELSAEGKLKVLNYCAEDTASEARILEELPPMTSSEREIAEYTRMTNRRGICVDVDLVEEDKTRLNEWYHRCLKAIPWHRDAAPLSYRALSEWCASQGLKCPKKTNKKDEECADLMSEQPKLKEMLGYLRGLRQSNMMVKKIESLMQRVGDDNIMPLDLIYCGAPHTRRWSSQGFNVQNLDKEPINIGNNETVWSRNWLVPRPGKKFLILDLAQIEPRCLNWLAGNDKMMEALRHGFSYYEAYCQAARGWKGVPGSIKAEYGKQKYTLLKNEALGLGFGMGWEKFISYNAQSGTTVTPEDAKKTVAMFRSNNKCVTDFWAHLDNLLTSGIRDKEKHLAIDLPNGEPIHYFNMARTAKGAIGFVIRGDRSHLSKAYLWGGVVAENVTQRMARDVLAGAVIRLERSDFPVIFTSHDEAIIEVDEADATEDTEKQIFELFTRAPDWAPDLPLGAEGSWADAYTK